MSTSQLPSSPVVDVPSTAQSASSPVKDALTTAQVPSSPVVDVPYNAQSASFPVVDALSTSQLPSSPVVDVPSTAQSPLNPATKADVSSRYQPPLLLSNSYRKTLPKRRCHGPVLLKAKASNLPVPSTSGPSTSSEWYGSYQATTVEEALNLLMPSMRARWLMSPSYRP